MSVSKLCSDIVAKAAVDHDSREIQDITSAMEELLNRLFSGEITVNYYPRSLKFRCLSIQPCGSMAEKTSLWKSARRQGGERKYIEYDNLVLLDGVENAIEIRQDMTTCPGCRKLDIGKHEVDQYNITDAFLNALYSRKNTFCSCHAETNVSISDNDSRDNRPCDYCRVDKGTGYLHIAKLADFNHRSAEFSEHCSLVVYWSSNTDSLMAPNIDTLQLTERIDRLVIRVDILPAFVIPCNRAEEESGLRRFVIPKGCPECNEYDTFMVSYCRYEWDVIHNAASSKHKETYSMIKFLYGQFSYWTETDQYLKSYHAKVAFIKHCETCTDNGEDCTRCVTDILQSLVEAYTSGTLNLPEFHALRSLRLPSDNTNRYVSKLSILSMISVVSELKILADDKQGNSLYQLRHVVDLIKRMCLTLLDGKLDMKEVDGRSMLLQCDNKVPSPNILVASLEDKEIVAWIVLFGLITQGQIQIWKRRLQCPPQELPLLRFRMECMVQKIKSSNTSHITDQTVRLLNDSNTTLSSFPLNSVSDRDSDCDSGSESSNSKLVKAKRKGRNSPRRNVFRVEADIHNDSGADDVSVKQLLAALSSDMHMMYNSLHDRIDKFEAGLEQRISNKVAQLLDKRVNTELSRIKKDVDTRLDSFKETLRSEINEDLDEINEKLERFQQPEARPNRALNVVIRGLPESESENIESKVNSLIKDGLHIRNVSVKSAERKVSRNQSKPGVVIASLKSADDKRKIMEQKSNLKDSRQYKDLFIHHDQSPEHRIMANNFKTVLSALNDTNANLSLRGTRVIRGNQQHESVRGSSPRRRESSGNENRQRHRSGQSRNANNQSDSRSGSRSDARSDRYPNHGRDNSSGNDSRDNRGGSRGGRGRRGGNRGRSGF